MGKEKMNRYVQNAVSEVLQGLGQASVFVTTPMTMRGDIVYGYPRRGGYGGYNPDLSYSDIVRLSNGSAREWHDYRNNKDVYVFPSTQAYVNWVDGICNALHRGYQNGFWIAYTRGAEFIEPGVFHPTKSWDQMVDESSRLRAGDRDEKWDFCTGWYEYTTSASASQIKALPRGRYGGPVSIYNNLGKWFCDLSSGSLVNHYSFTIPTKWEGHFIPAATAARWVATYNQGPKIEAVICQNTPKQEILVDPKFQHTYNISTFDTATIGPDGVKSRSTNKTQGYIVRVHPKEATWMSLTPLQLTAALNAGRFVDWDNATWLDDGRPALQDLMAFAPNPGGSCPPDQYFDASSGTCKPVAGGPSTANAILYGGLALGAVALVASLVMKKDTK